jgi:hypothetical protein
VNGAETGSYPVSISFDQPEIEGKTETSSNLFTQETSELEQIFNGLAKTWREATGGYSLTYRRYVHPSYQMILTLGKDVVPFILGKLQREPDRWFEALKALTSQNPAENAKTFDESVNCWLEWGKEKGFIS